MAKWHRADRQPRQLDRQKRKVPIRESNITAAQSFLNQPASRSDKSCSYLIIQEGKGMCGRGKSCRNDHFLFGDDKAIARIPCGLSCWLGGACKLENKCIYSHEAPPAPSPAESPRYSPFSELLETSEGGSSSATTSPFTHQTK